MLQILPILGVEAFVDTAKASKEAQDNGELLTCSIKGLTATGYLTPNGLMVLKDSQAVIEERPSAHRWPSVQVKRNSLIDDLTLAKTSDALVFTKDVEFSSPSAATAVIHGGKVSLKDLQEV